MLKIQKNTQWINSLKGMCILLVVLNHIVSTSYIPSLSVIDQHTVITKLWVAINVYLAPLRMPAFFFISGLLATSAVMNRTWQEVSTKRAFNLLYLYLLWCLVQWISITFINRDLSFDDWTLMARNAAYSASAEQFALYVATAMASPWYLYALVMYFVACKLFKDNILLLISLCVVVNYIAATGLVPWWGPESVAQNAIFFTVGCYFGAPILSWMAHRKNVMILLLCLAPLALIHSLFGINKSIFHSAIAICVGIVICQQINQYFSMRTLNWIGKNTLQIYVLHKLLTELLAVPMLGALVQHQAFDNAHFAQLWLMFYPLVGLIFCTAGALTIWWALNRGVGRVLFQYPTLIVPRKVLN